MFKTHALHEIILSTWPRILKSVRCDHINTRSKTSVTRQYRHAEAKSRVREQLSSRIHQKLKEKKTRRRAPLQQLNQVKDRAGIPPTRSQQRRAANGIDMKLPEDTRHPDIPENEIHPAHLRPEHGRVIEPGEIHGCRPACMQPPPPLFPTVRAPPSSSSTPPMPLARTLA